MKFRTLAVAASLVAASGGVLAGEKPVPLNPGPGREIVDANCGGCHSLDYIRTNAPFMTAKVWEAEVSKMINAFGAPIEPANAKTIIEYLSSTYGAPQS